MTTPRRATSADAAELARLRTVMFDALGNRTDPTWTDQCAGALARVLDDEPSVAAYVIDDGTGRLLSIAVGHYAPRLLPSVRTSAACVGEVLSVTTDLGHRRRGYARACVAALLTWLTAHDISHVTLRASPEGQRLYAGLGFAPMPDVFMSWRPSPR